ncbi:metal-dependent phosphohydrolase [Rhodobacterales bacterium]|nr:metal-dependent phosphohydrolase [Rhodobacterales bacterium]
MITLPELAADTLGDFLMSHVQRRFGKSDPELAELLPSLACIAMECIGNSDALYHNIEHTMLVTLAGHDILRGRGLNTHIAPLDYAHVIVACLTHDIGYVRGILPGDDADGFQINAAGDRVKLPRGASDAALTPYHVDRSKLYIFERISGTGLLDPQRICDAIEGTRFPPTVPTKGEQISEEAALVRAADLIGQLGDPHYIRKANALYYEFEESGLNRQLGYETPADLVLKYPQFYWNSVAPYIQTGIQHLKVTASGRQWISNLYSNLFVAERDMALVGPQT